jgi:hypothetical protein
MPYPIPTQEDSARSVQERLSAPEDVHKNPGDQRIGLIVEVARRRQNVAGMWALGFAGIWRVSALGGIDLESPWGPDSLLQQWGSA